MCFSGGIHGVGKTSFCNDYLAPAGYHCISASSLIKASNSFQDKTKQVRDLEDNQRALLSMLALEKQKHSHLVLDGHFCLKINQDSFKEIPTRFFKKIAPNALILLQDKPQKIVSRLQKRDGSIWSTSFVRDFQIAEEKHAMSISRELKIPLTILNPTNKL